MKSMYFWRARSTQVRKARLPDRTWQQRPAISASALDASLKLLQPRPRHQSDDGTHSATPYARSPAPPEGHKAKPWLNTATNAPGSRASWLYRLTPNARN